VNLFGHVPGTVASLDVTLNEPLQLSVFTTAPVFGGGTKLAQETVTLAGILMIVGGITSKIAYVYVQLAVVVPLQAV
jgi:hypothetical protein